MLQFPVFMRALLMGLLAISLTAAPSAGQSAQTTFYKAYYLEHGVGDIAGAAELYEQVVDSGRASSGLKGEAKTRLAACREDLVAADFARLMPPAPLAYIEINRPGESVRDLLEQLGILSDGEPLPTGENRLAISPAIIDAALGLRGFAAAVTGFDMGSQQPSGVAVLHPGDMELVRGLIETALPAATEIVEPVGGFATYRVEDVLITLTKRLVIAGTSEMEIEGVLDRLRNSHEDSLANDDALAATLARRDGALVYFFVNPKPLLPMIQPMLHSAAAQHQELAIANAVLDIENFRSLTGRFDINGDGLRLEMALHLDQGHQNLVYNFLRGPAIDPAALRCVPAGAAACFTLAMNEAPEHYGHSSSDEQPIVTALDLGRELFANINGIAVYAMPRVSPRVGDEIPDVAAVITVNDPAKSEAIWHQFLGLASLASGGSVSMAGRPSEIEGVPVRSYAIEDEATIHVATLDHDILIAMTRDALEASIHAKRSRDSILDDPGFARAMDQIGPHTTLAMVAHPGRCFEIGKAYMGQDELDEVEPFAGLLADTSVLVAVSHSDRELRFTMAAQGVPDISDLVAELIQEELHGKQRRANALTTAVQHGDWSEALRLLDDRLEHDPGDFDTLRSKFRLLGLRMDDHESAREFGRHMLQALSENHLVQNNFAWELLTEDEYDQRFDDVALKFSELSNKLTEHGNWAYLDTLALAQYRAGNAAKAVELEEKAIAICKNDGSSAALSELQSALQKFRDAVENE